MGKSVNSFHFFFFFQSSRLLLYKDDDIKDDAISLCQGLKALVSALARGLTSAFLCILTLYMATCFLLMVCT